MSRLHNAAGSGDIEAVRECIAAGTDVNAVGFRGFTPSRFYSFAECEERNLTGETLEEARKLRVSREKSYARWQKQEAIKAARMQNNEE